MAAMSTRRAFAHSASRPAQRAWPSARVDADEFVPLPTDQAPPAQATLIAARVSGSPILFAHSILGVSAALATPTLHPAALVLVEPALYDLVRGNEAIERHISAVTEARSLAATGDLLGFWGIIRPLMFGGSFDAAHWETERPVAEHWARTPLPWGNGLREQMLQDTPILVVTGGWNDEYECIAERLVRLGAEHEVLEGAQHRPQDLPGFASVVDSFSASLD